MDNFKKLKKKNPNQQNNTTREFCERQKKQVWSNFQSVLGLPAFRLPSEKEAGVRPSGSQPQITQQQRVAVHIIVHSTFQCSLRAKGRLLLVYTVSLWLEIPVFLSQECLPLDGSERHKSLFSIPSLTTFRKVLASRLNIQQILAEALLNWTDNRRRMMP